jgi:intracellular multiplication protein IcmE
LAACLFGIGVVLWSRLGGNGAGRSVQLQAVRPESPGDMKAVGVEASGEYARRSASYATASADAAARDGRTYVAPLVPSVRPALQPTPAPEPREEPARKTVITVPPRPAPAAPAPQPRRQGDARIVGYLGQLDKRWQPQGGAAVMTLNPPTPKVRAGSQAPEVRDVREGLPGLKPGDILYCVNRVSLDSDAPGPAMVEVLEGPYAGARAIGSFTRAGEHLVLEFSSLTLSDGRNHPVRGYAIDPRTDRTAVRSAVDTHAVERWLKFAAAKFLEGFGDAVSSTRSSAYVTPYGSGYTTSRLDLHEQLWSAAGKVGQGAARMLERDFSVPPTVTLRSGTEMGVLLVQVGAAEAPAARESGGRGSDAQEGGGRRDGGYYGTRQQQMESSRGRSP